MIETDEISPQRVPRVRKLLLGGTGRWFGMGEAVMGAGERGGFGKATVRGKKKEG